MRGNTRVLTSDVPLLRTLIFSLFRYVCTTYFLIEKKLYSYKKQLLQLSYLLYCYNIFSSLKENSRRGLGVKKDMLILVIEATVKSMFGWLQDYRKDIFSLTLDLLWRYSTCKIFQKYRFFLAFEANKIMSLNFFLEKIFYYIVQLLLSTRFEFENWLNHQSSSGQFGHSNGSHNCNSLKLVISRKIHCYQITAQRSQ